MHELTELVKLDREVKQFRDISYKTLDEGVHRDAWTVMNKLLTRIHSSTKKLANRAVEFTASHNARLAAEDFKKGFKFAAALPAGVVVYYCMFDSCKLMYIFYTPDALIRINKLTEDFKAKFDEARKLVSVMNIMAA